MKKITWLMMLVAVFAVAMTSCKSEDPTTPQPENPTPKPEPEPEPEPAAVFDIKVGEVTSSSIAYTVTPADLEVEYLCVLYDAETVEETTRDEFLVQELMMELEAEARSAGKTLLEYMPSVVDKGAIEDGLFKGLAPESDYYIIVFGVDAKNNYAANTEVFKKKVTTAALETIDVTFDIQTSVDGNTAEYTITPSNNDAIWYFYTLPKATFEVYTTAQPDGYGMSEQEFMIYCLQMDIDAHRQAGLTDNQIMNAIFHKGSLVLQAKGLNANTEYINMVAGFFVTPEGQVTIGTELTKTYYTTGDAQAVELTFDISVTDIEAMRAAIKITPSKANETFCWMIGQYDGVKTAEDIMDEIVAMYGGWMNNGAMLYKGVQDYTGGPGSTYKYKLDAADTEYYVIAFGYAGGVTTKPTMETFRTLPAPAAEDTTFEMTATEITPYGFKVSVKPSYSTTYYSFDCMTNAQFAELNQDELVEQFNAQFDEIYAMQKAYNPDTTVAQVLSMYYYRDAYSATASGMTPETTCSGIVMAISTETGHVAKVHTYPDIATTTALGSIAPTVEVFGHYSGEEENGSVFGQPAATKGRAITVLKYDNFEGARTLFGTLILDDLSNAATYPDSMIWGDLLSKWGSAVNKKQPYGFFVVDWEAVNTGFTYAVDNNGLPGEMGRCYSMATVDNKGNIEDLQNLVNELNAADSSSFSLPKSVVLGDEKSSVTLSDFVSHGVNVAMPEVEAAAPQLPVASEANEFPVTHITVL